MFFKAINTDDKAIVAALNASQAVIEFTPAGNILTTDSNFLNTVGYSLNDISVTFSEVAEASEAVKREMDKLSA